MHASLRLLPAALLLLAAPRALAAQHAEHTAAGAPAAGAPANTEGPMPLHREALGPFSRKVVTASPEAQAYFDQGMQLMYAFARDAAVRSFREAQRRDSSCAMCHWGEAWARGAYLNEPMDSAGAPEAYAASRRALALVSRARGADRALIEAIATRYAPAYDRAGRRALDSAYAKAMERVHAAHPRDLDVATLYGEALMLLEPRRGTWDLGKPAVQRIHSVLSAALDVDRGHPGACHLFVHATETTPAAGKAERCAELLGSSIPGASHINHMPSHTFNRIGRWGDAVRANIRAWHSDLRSASGEGFAIYPSHNLHMLLFSASMDGQGGVAEQAARDFAKQVGGGVFYRALVLLRFGRFDEILRLHEPAPAHPVQRGLWEFARGYAQLRTGAVDSARLSLGRVDSLARTTSDSTNLRGHTAKQLLGVTGGILRAELLRHEGKLAEAIPVLERAVALEDSLRYDEPEPLNFSARHWLGAVLLEAGRPGDAERVYRAALEDHPRTGWSLLGLEQALRAQGKAKEADEVKRQFAAAWARADTFIKASRF